MQCWQQHGNIYNLNVRWWFCSNFCLSPPQRPLFVVRWLGRKKKRARGAWLIFWWGYPAGASAEEREFLLSFFFKEFSLHFYGIHEIGLEIFICFEYMFWCSRWLSAHYSWLLIFCYSLLKEICFSFQGNVLHEIKWILNIEDLSE